MEQHWFSELRRKILRFARRHTNRAAAEDITQSTLMVLLERGPQEPRVGIGDVDRWAYSTARHKLGNHIKAHRRAQQRGVVLEETMDFASTQASPYEHLAAQALDAALTRACSRMASASHRAIIRLLREGATPEAIWQALQISTMEKTRKKIYEARIY